MIRQFLSLSYLICFIASGAYCQVDIDNNLPSDTLEFVEGQLVCFKNVIDKYELSPALFQKGLIADPLLNVQGKVPGVQIYNRGGDPNEHAIIRIRGLSSFDANHDPLVMIDNIPFASLSVLEPLTINSISFYKDGFAQNTKAERGANGIISITRKRAEYNSPLKLNYQGGVSTSSRVKEYNVLSAEEFVAIGGEDFGSDVNYVDEIVRTATSHMHHLSLEKGFDNFKFNVSGNYRNQLGILEKSDFESYTIYSSVQASFFDGRLEFDITGNTMDRYQDVSYREAFKYAANSNPTNPILAADAPFPFSDEYGGYFELLGLFDSYNPVALLDLATRRRKQESFLFTQHMNFKMNRNIHLNVNTAQHEVFVYDKDIRAGNSKFGGFNAAETNINYGDEKIYFDYQSADVQYQDSLGNGKLRIRIGAENQNVQKTNETLTVFTSDNNLEAFDYGVKDIAEGAEIISDFESSFGRIVWGGYFTDLSYSIDEKYFADVSLRYANSIYHDYSFYPSLQFGYKKNFQSKAIQFMYFEMGYGKTSSSLEPLDQDNPALIYFEESKNQYDFSAQYHSNQWVAKLSLYSNSVDNINLNNYFIVTENTAQISTQGIDLGIGFDFLKRKNISYSSYFNISTSQSIIDAEQDFEYYYGFTDLNSKSILRLTNGAEFGEFVGPIYEGIDDSGNIVVQDINNDGKIVLDISNPEELDFAVLGNAFPDFEFGWDSHLHVRGFDINVFIRGAIGHSLVNETRLIQEPKVPSTSNVGNLYNFITTSKEPEGLEKMKFTSLYVEDASFVKLDNVSISRTFNLWNSDTKATFTLAGQNLLTLTNYTGTDPEPVFYGDNPNATILPGIDKRTSYRPSRTISFMLNVVF